VAGQLTMSTVLLVLISILSGFPFLAWRWHLIVREESSQPARRHVETYFIAAYLGAFTPGHLGTDVYRVVSMRTQGVRMSPIVAMLLRERLLGLFGYLLFLAIAASIALQIDERIPAEGRGFLLLCAVLSGFGVAAIIGARYVFYLLRLISIRRVQRYITDLLELINRAFRFRRLAEAAKLLGLTIIGDVNLWVLAFYIVALAIGVDISFFLIGAIVIIVELVRLIPLTVQGIGVREAAFAALFALVGQDPATGFVIGTVCFVLLNVATLIVGLAGYALAFRNRRLAEAAMRDG
jgi:glycosyltransferase 2 family protein